MLPVSGVDLSYLFMPGDCFNGNLNMLEVKEQRAQYEVKVMKQIRNLYYNHPPPTRIKIHVHCSDDFIWLVVDNIDNNNDDDNE